MSICLTRARPYAKAIFNLALEEDRLRLWQDTLIGLADIVNECDKKQALDDPKITILEKIKLFTEVIKQAPEGMVNLVRLLIERKNLFLLPAIATSYRQLFLAHNNMLEVKVTSRYELDANQKERLLVALARRYKKEILLQCHLDATLIGGAVVCVEDKVIDGSIKGMLQRLKQDLLLKSTYAEAK